MDIDPHRQRPVTMPVLTCDGCRARAAGKHRARSWTRTKRVVSATLLLRRASDRLPAIQPQLIAFDTGYTAYSKGAPSVGLAWGP